MVRPKREEPITIVDDLAFPLRRKNPVKLPAGPNSPVGVVWMALSKPHYGIHGTSSPETIGYANSHGCVRLTDWDADRLASLIRAGTPVEFQ